MTDTALDQTDNTGDRARAWRKSRGLSQRDLAELTGYTSASVADYERGISRNSGGALSPAMWRRYRLVCAAVDAGLQDRFDWQPGRSGL